MPTTYVLMVTDMSGSMAGNAVAVRSGFNEYVAALAADKSKMKFKVTAYTFNTEMEALAEQLDPAQVPVMDHDNYHPEGMTALLDSVAFAVMGLEDSVTLKKRDKVLVVIQTDGQENSSKEWEFNRLAAKLKELEDGGQWGFLYVGAGVDAWANGYRLGIASVLTTNSAASHSNTYGDLYRSTSRYAGGQSTQVIAGEMEEAHVKAGTAADPKLLEEVAKALDEVKNPRTRRPRPRKGFVGAAPAPEIPGERHTDSDDIG
jgi:hypothetical protein